MQHRFFSGICPQKYNEQMQCTPAHDCISSGESIPGELLLSRAHFRFDSINFEALNYIYKLLKKAAIFSRCCQPPALNTGPSEVSLFQAAPCCGCRPPELTDSSDQPLVEHPPVSENA